MRIYLIIAVIVMVGGAYVMGGRIAKNECLSDASELRATDITNMVEMQRIVNEKTVHTGVNDIRGILRDKYTIAD
ncbi:MAG: hypothetical protein J6T57_01125 [Alphaproteobacteria bacterium]|nr:hypothetical protein [Alphaproteobacteria bacterium]